MSSAVLFNQSLAASVKAVTLGVVEASRSPAVMTIAWVTRNMFGRIFIFFDTNFSETITQKKNSNLAFVECF